MDEPREEINLTTVPDPVWEIARKRERVIREIISNWPTYGYQKKAVQVAAAELGISFGHCYRLIKIYRVDSRTRSLLPKTPGPRPGKHRRIDPRVEKIIENEIQTYYLTQLKPRKSAVIKAIQARCHHEGLSKPSRDTIRARIALVSPRISTSRRQGSKRARDIFAPMKGSLIAERPLQIVQIDHTPLDVMAVERETREVIGRPFITLAHDVRTRMYSGLYLSFDPPSAASVAACLSHAVSDKAPWLEARHLRGSWPVSGLCEIIHVDNGKEFHSRAFTRACEDYGIEVRYRPPGTPHMGGHVERRIGHLAQEIHLLDGTTFSNVKERGVYDSAGRACLTIAEIEWLLATIVLEHHATLHSGIGTSPLSKWNSETEGREARMPADMRAFYRDFLPFEERKLQRDGLHLFGIRYWHDALAPFLDNKESIVVHYDPSNLAKVYVRGRSGAYLEVPYRDLRSPPISKWELKAVTRAGRREGRRNVDESTIFEMVLARRKLLEEARSSSRRARRDLARGARLPPDSQLRIEGLNPDNQRDDESTDQDRPVELPYYDTEEWDE